LQKAEEILNKKSGWKAITGTADFSQIARAEAEGPHRLAFDLFVDRIVGYLGSYFVKLDGQVDAIVFSGGIGEKSAYLRAEVVSKLHCLGFVLDKEKNEADSALDVEDIGKGKMKILVCRTDEEAEMATQLLRSS
jgi:acetate kinase